MARKRVTIRDVADRAGVSPTTVSFVLNDVQGPNLRDETRQRVLKAARELGYVPSAAARSLASGQTSTISLVIFDAAQIQVDAFLPPLTTIWSKPLEVGRRAGEMLISLIQGEELEETQVVIEGAFVSR